MWHESASLELSEGVRFFQQPGCRRRIQDRLALSQGSAGFSGGDEQGYHPRAVLPQGPWVQPDPDTLSLLVAQSEGSDYLKGWNPAESVAILKMSDADLQCLQRGISRSLKASIFDPGEYAEFLKGMDADRVGPAVSGILENAGLRTESLEFLRVHTAPPGLKTITRESRSPDQALLMGLHLDSVDALPRARRNRARSRLCINIGAEPRHLLIVNQTIDSMFSQLPAVEKTLIAKYFRGHEVGYKFLETFPRYPVIRLTIDPGECYIAPTDNVLHDASTLEKLWVDVSLHLVGHFSSL